MSLISSECSGDDVVKSQELKRGVQGETEGGGNEVTGDWNSSHGYRYQYRYSVESRVYTILVLLDYDTDMI